VPDPGRRLVLETTRGYTVGDEDGCALAVLLLFRTEAREVLQHDREIRS
jgi:hypothetical protein